jgi:beta-lactamase class A
VPVQTDRGVHESIAAIAAPLGGTVGVAARNLASGAEAHVNADDLFPMASCFKIPVMVEVLRRVDAGALRLEDRLTLTEADKSPGSSLIHCHEGLRPSVRDLLYLMITLSDNTATDMLWRHVGLGAVNETMRTLGLQTIDCFMPNREYFLIESGAGEEWARLSGPEIVARWRELEARGEYEEAFRRVLEENARLSGAGFLHLYERRWGRDESLGYDDSFAVDQALDNMGSPHDIAELLAMIAQNRCASAPSCRLMIEIMAHQEWREKIPAGLPDGLLVVNKTGGVSGTSNDAAIVYTPCGAPVIMVVFWKGLGYEAKARADEAIAEIAGVLYEHLGEPA